MGYGDISCLNPDSKIRTERIDELARSGISCTDAHASSAVCTPSRYSILTGRYAWRSTLKQGVNWGYTPHLIEDGRMTVASFLKSHGYETACIGKWHLGLDWLDPAGNPTQLAEEVDFSRGVRNGPLQFGFDTFFGISASLDMEPYVYLDGDRPTEPPNRITEYAKGKMFWRKGPTGADFFHIDVLPTLTRKAEEFIHTRGWRPGGARVPFFLYFPLPAPHTPILPTAEYRGKSGTNGYGDFCLQVDSVVGRIMDAVAAVGATEETVIVFTSDNGCSPMADFRELASFGHNPSYIFRGHKADIYDGGHRIPLIVRWPEVISRQRTSSAIVCLGDLLATVAEIVGDNLPDTAGEDSVSNLPIWLSSHDPDKAGEVREAIVHHSINGSFSLRKGRWKLELCPGSGGWSYPKPGEEPDGSPPIQLYDMEADIGERVNVYDRNPAVVAELTALLTQYIRNGRSTPGTPQQNTGVKYWPQLNWLSESEL